MPLSTRHYSDFRPSFLRFDGEYGTEEACRILRSLADEIEGLMREYRDDAGDPERHDSRDA